MHLGIFDVWGMLSSMTWGQFLYWHAYAQLEPFGEERADLRSAQIVSMIANVNIPKGKKKTSPMDFMPDFAKHAAGATGEGNAPAKPARPGRRAPLTDVNAWKAAKRMAAAHAQPSK